MSTRFAKSLDNVVNVLIIIVALLLIGFLIQQFLLPRGPSRRMPVVGKTLDLPSQLFTVRPKTLILGLSATCHFCTESAPFYRRLMETVKDENTKIIAILPGTLEESSNYLAKLGLYGVEIYPAPISSVNSDATPTLVLANEKGEVSAFWIGKLSTEQETEVIDQVRSTR